MARDAIAFLDALGLTEVDLLGYSLGGFVAQELTLLRQRMVRRLVLAGTRPKAGGEQMHGSISDVAAVADADNKGPEDSESSRQKGRECLQRMMARREGRDRPNGPEVGRAQYDAIVECGIPTGPVTRSRRATARRSISFLAGARPKSGGCLPDRNSASDGQDLRRPQVDVDKAALGVREVAGH
jgi:pimeloyl-ACP methyl ester carboxylesterase